MQIIKSILSTTLFSIYFLISLVALEANASEIRLSPDPGRSTSVLLEGSSIVGNTHIYVESTQASTKQVRFYLDVSTSAAPTKIENLAPYDLVGTMPDDSAIPFDSTSLIDGYHTLTVEVENSAGGIEVLESQFLVANDQPSLQISDAILNTNVTEGTASTTLSADLTTNDGSTPTFNFSESTPWLDLAASSNITPANLNIVIDSSGLPPGQHQSIINFTASGYVSTQLTVNVNVVPENTSGYQLYTSLNENRSSPAVLNGSSLIGDAHIFVSPETDVKQVRFYLDKPTNSTATKIENVEPYDFNGTRSNNDAIPFDTSTLPDGSHTIITKVILNDSSEVEITSTFDVVNAVKGFVSSPTEINETASSSDSPIEVNVLLGLNSAADGLSPTYNATSSASWLTVAPETAVAPETLILTLNPAGLTDGTHLANIEVTSPDYETTVIPVTFVISEFTHTLQSSTQNIAVNSVPNVGQVSRTVSLTTSDNSSANYSVSSDAAWLTTIPQSGITPDDLTININTNTLTEGIHEGRLTISASTYAPLELIVNVTISENNKCAPVTCSDIKVSLPYELNFDADAGHIVDINSIGTGFTYIQPSSDGGLLTNNIEIDTSTGLLNLTTTKGIQYLSNNNLNNALGAGFAGPNQIADISTTLISPPKGQGKYEQAGLWFGFDEDHYIKLVLLSTPTGSKVELAYESGGITEATTLTNINDVSASDLTIRMIATPSSKTVSGYYSINGGVEHEIDTFTVSPEMFSFDAAGIDPEIGTRSFAGIFATNRNSNTPLTYSFSQFSIVENIAPPTSTNFNFTRKSHDLSFPTSMVWAPDGKLYVTELFGTIHALTYDADLNVINDQVIDSLTNQHGGRLTLGITYYHHNPSDPNDFSLWVSHSSPSVNNGVANSGTVSKLSGPGFTTVEDTITGLPRAKANHAPNSLHFGPDDKLYIAIGGNTGAGAPVTDITEFGDREEQPLSAALVVADVFSPSFDGTCDNTADIYGPPPCDVSTYSTGLRNTYDFVFHSNNGIYAPDNGLGVTGAFPAQSYPDCSGLASSDPWNAGGQNPLEQPDLLLKLLDGKYYGHPNPSRDECVFKDGSYQAAATPLNYEPPMAIMGAHTSSNGIIEYKSDKFCGKLKGNLLITNYSLGDNIVRVVLNPAGDVVTAQDSLVGSFNDPLTLSENSTGDLFVAEFGNGKITSLRGVSTGCWEALSTSPEAILDAGGTSHNGDLYTIGGKLPSGPINRVYKYTTTTDTWTQLADKPGAAVENPAVTTVNNSIYVFGGSTLPFSGAVSNSYKYDIDTGDWSTIASMPTARGGIRAEVINGLIYIAGGMDSTGASISTVEVYNPVTNTWSTATPMNEVRDNPGTAVINDKLYVMGGRERTSGGVTINGTKTSAEMYDPSTNSWSYIASLPTGRRTMVTSTIDEKVQVIGGEYNDSDPDHIFNENEEYDPVFNVWTPLPNTPYPRHGAAFSTINNALYINGGGDKGGSAFTDATTKYSR